MPVFTSKTSTDPGPFDALRPAAERGGAGRTSGIDDFETTLEESRGPQQSTHPAPEATDEDAELDSLFRFQEIPVSPEMRRELLGAKLPLASADQLADTQPPNKSSLTAPTAPGFVDRHGPTEPALVRPNALLESERPNYETPLLDGDSYSTTAPTLLSVRRRRLRNRRLVMAAFGALLLAMLSGVAWRRYTRATESLARDSSADRAKTPRIAGNRPAKPLPPSPAQPTHPVVAAGDGNLAAAVPTSSSRIDESEGSQGPGSANAANTDSQSAQLSLSATDATSSSPLSADSRSASRDAQRAHAPKVQASNPASGSPSEPRAASSTPIAVPRDDTDPNRQAGPAGKPTKSKAFDPEELIF